MRRKLLMVMASFSLVLVLAAMPFMAACAPEEAPPPPPPPTKDKIVIGAARPLSGPLAFFEENAFGPIYKMWVEEVNARGGIYVEEYGKKLPIEMLVYDDKSDMGTMTRLVEKLILEDKVDFLFPSASTAFLFASAPIFNKHEYILMGAEGGATSIRDMLPGLPYFFGMLQFSDNNQMPVLADILAEQGVKTVAIMFIEDLHGIEYSGVAVRELGRVGIDVVMIKGTPPDIKDVSLILKEAKALDVDAFLSFTYPDASFLVTGTAIELGINFDAFLVGPGGNFDVYKVIFGPALEGVMGEGAFNAKSSPAIAEFCDKFIARWGEGIMDWWGHVQYWAQLEIFEQAIVKAGTLDQKVIRDIMATETFDTILGPTWFYCPSPGGGGILAVECFPGQIGQWQSGIFEVIDPGEKRTAEPIYPKPDWPTPPAE